MAGAATAYSSYGGGDSGDHTTNNPGYGEDPSRPGFTTSSMSGK